MAKLSLFKNYLNVLLAQSKTHFTQQLLVIVGLGLGILACSAILHYSLTEFNYDKQYDDNNSVYRITLTLPELDLGGDGLALTPAGMKSLFHDLTNEQHVATQILPMNTFFRLYYGEKRLVFPNVVAADQDFTQIFNLPVKHGELKLGTPGTIAISESLANKLYNKSNVVGQQLSLEKDTVLTITAVLADLPHQTHLSFDAIVSLKTISGVAPNMMRGLRGSNFYTYFKTINEINLAQVTSQIDARLSETMRVKVNTIMQPLTSIHLTPNLLGEMKPSGDKRLLWLLITIVLLLLMITAVNYFNTNSAFYSTRLKEISVRKAIGASEKQIFIQLLLDGVVVLSIASAIAVVIAEVFSPQLSSLLNINLSFNLDLVLTVALMALLLNLLGNLYPSYKAAKVPTSAGLKGLQDDLHGRKGLSRTLLVCSQSFLTVILLVLCFVMYEQSSLLANKHVGYAKNNVYLAPEINPTEYSQKFESFKLRAEQIAGVEKVTIAEQFPTMPFNDSTSALTISGQPKSSLDRVPLVGVGFDFIESLNINIIAGRPFKKSFIADVYRKDKNDNEYFGGIVSRALIEQAGWSSPEMAINQTISWENKHVTIVGVFDFVEFNSGVTSQTPVILGLSYSSQGRWTIATKLSDGAPSDTLAKVQHLYDEQFDYPNASFDSLSMLYNQQYKDFFRQLTATLILTLIIVSLTLFGVFGLAKFASERNTKEIAIRKILGAKAGNIVNLLFKKYFYPILLSCFIAIPAAWWVGKEWLNAFNFSGTVTLEYLVISFASTVVITFITIGTVVLNASSRPPAETLRSE